MFCWKKKLASQFTQRISFEIFICENNLSDKSFHVTVNGEISSAIFRKERKKLLYCENLNKKIANNEVNERRKQSLRKLLTSLPSLKYFVNYIKIFIQQGK